MNLSKTALLTAAAAAYVGRVSAQLAVQAQLDTTIQIWGLSLADVANPSAAASITSATTADFHSLIFAMLRSPALDYVALSSVTSTIWNIPIPGRIDVDVSCFVTGSDALRLGELLSLGLLFPLSNSGFVAPFTARTFAAAVALRPDAAVGVSITDLAAMPVNANGSIVPTPSPSGPASATATLALKVSGVTVDVLNSAGGGIAVTGFARGMLTGSLTICAGVTVPIASVTAYLTPDSIGTAALGIATAGIPQVVDGVWPVVSACLNAQLASPIVAQAIATFGTTMRRMPSLANYPIVMTFDGASASAGAVSPGAPATPFPVAQVTASLRLNGIPAINVAVTDASALCSALVNDLTRWAQATLPVQVRQFLDAPAALVQAAQSVADGNSLQLSVSSNIVGVPVLANVIASALRPLLSFPSTQATIIPTTLALATAVMARTRGAVPPGPPVPNPNGGGMITPNATITLVSVTATGTDPTGGVVMTPLPSPAAPSTVATLTFNFRLNATYAAISSDSALPAALIVRLATAVASQLSLQIGVTLSPSDITVTISAGGARALLGAASGGVVLTASAPVREAVPGAASLYADATSAAFQSTPSLLAPVTEAASAALGQPVVATVVGASAGPSEPLYPAQRGGSGGAVAGGVIGGLLLAALVVAGGIFLVRRSRARTNAMSEAPTISSAYVMVADFSGGSAVNTQVRLGPAA